MELPNELIGLYFVEEVLSEPVPSKKYTDEWWEIKFSYRNDNGELRTKIGTVHSKEAAEKYKPGFGFMLLREEANN